MGNLLDIFGIGEKRVKAMHAIVTGRIVSVERCWWLKVNTKPVRRHSFDGAVFPHMAEFVYEVDGIQYRGKRYVSYRLPAPWVGQTVKVWYDPQRPQHYAAEI